MSQHLSANLDFITSFVETCHAQGFNEKQAAELLNNYAKNEFYLTDKDFREGVNNGLQKQAGTVPKALFNLFKALGRSAVNRPGLSVPVLTGAATGAFTPEGILPEGYGGPVAGSILGGLLGLAGTRGKGLGSAIKNIGKAVTRGGVLRTTGSQGLKLMTHPKLWVGAGKGALGGLAATGAASLKDLISNRLPNISPNSGIPSYMLKDYSGGTSEPSAADINLYDTSGDILDQAKRSIGGGAGVAGSSSFINTLKNNKQQLLDLDNRIAELQNNLRTATTPAAYGQRAAIQTQIDSLKMQRNALSQSFDAAENKFYKDTTNLINQANQREALANRGLSGAQTEFENIMRRKELEGQGGVTGYLMQLYNRLAGTEGRLSELDPIYRGYQSEIEKAKQLRDLGISNVLQ